MKTIVRKNRGADKIGRRSISTLKRSAKKRLVKPAGSTPKAKTRRGSRVSATNIYHPGQLIDGEEALGAAVTQLLALDPELVGKLIAAAGSPPLRRREPGFAGLYWIIVSQQVSTASANAIFKRVEANLSPLGSASLLAADDAALRACGLSLAKMRALRALAGAVEGGSLDLAGLALLTAEEAHRALVAVKGIGPWTADIFLLFCLGHPDAFPPAISPCRRRRASR